MNFEFQRIHIGIDQDSRSDSIAASAAKNVSFTYDSTANGNKGIGQLTGYSNDGGATVMVYDAYGNVLTQTEMLGSQIDVTAYQYDRVHRIKQITYPSGRIVIYTRNVAGQITQVQTKDQLRYNALGQRTQKLQIAKPMNYQ